MSAGSCMSAYLRSANEVFFSSCRVSHSCSSAECLIVLFRFFGFNSKCVPFNGWKQAQCRSVLKYIQHGRLPLRVLVGYLGISAKKHHHYVLRLRACPHFHNKGWLCTIWGESGVAGLSGWQHWNTLGAACARCSIVIRLVNHSG
jgi:hypothetical protein